MDYILRHYQFYFVVIVAAGVQAAVEAREVAARNLEPDAMPRRKIIAGRVQIDPQPVRFAWLHPDRLIEALAIPGAQDSVLEVEGGSVGIDVYQLRGEVGIARGRADKQHHFERPCDFHALRERRRRVNQNIGTALGCGLVARAIFTGGCGMVRIVGETVWW